MILLLTLAILLLVIILLLYFKYSKKIALAIAITLIVATIIIVKNTFFPKAILDGLENSSSWVQSDEEILFFRYDSTKKGSSLHSIQINGDNEKKLIDSHVGSYVLSPDGNKIAYQRYGNLEHSECGILNLVTMESNIISSPCDDIDWDPKSQSVFYLPNDKEVYIYNLLDGSSKKVTQAENVIVGPRWSRDGTKLYYNDLHSKEYFEFDLLLNTSKIIATGGSKWKNLIPPDKMHFNQYGSGGYWERLSPTGKHWLQNQEGSLVLANADKSPDRILVKNIGDYNSDFGATGFVQPYWTADEKYALGSFEGEIVVVEILTGRCGIVTKGNNPLSYQPHYHPGDYDGITPMYYFFIREAGR